MKKKLCLLLVAVVCCVTMVACQKTTEAPAVTTATPTAAPTATPTTAKPSYTVTYNAVEIVEPEEEGGENTYTVSIVGTETVEEGGKISGIAVAADGSKSFAGEYYTAKEVDAASAVVYDVTTAVTADLALYAEAGEYGVYQELASGSGYTLNYATTVFPTTWNSHIYETETDSTILGYSSTGFYEFDYNETKDGYVWADAMAVGDPVDVSADYVGEDWGIEEGDTARAWEVTIRSDLCWDDGTAITAQTFVDSTERLLNPKALNSRADDYTYSGSFVIHNAENFVYQGSLTDVTVASKYATFAEADEAGYEIYLDSVFVNSAMEGWQGIDMEYLKAHYNSYYVGWFTIYTGEGEARTAVLDAEGNPVNFFDKYDVFADEDGKIAFTEEMYNDFSNCDGWNPVVDDELSLMCSFEYRYPVVAMDEVGVIATAPNKVVFILDQELSGFYLKYGMSTWLVKSDVYDACDNLDAEGNLPEGEAYRSTYCTTAANSPSYGPYKLAEYQLDKYFKLVKNTNWWAYSDVENQGLYQTTAIVYTMCESASTRLQMFLSGLFDSYGLTSDDMADYQNSDYTYFTDGDSTWFIMFNPDQVAYEAAEWNYTTEGETQVKGAHKNIDKEIMSIKEFRMALSFALNRAAYELACDPTGNVAKALLSSMIISNPEEGEVYRNTDAAKQAIVDFWGLTDQIGSEKLYKTVDDAIDSITGYNLEMAKEYFDIAYAEAVEAGYMDEDDVVEICIGTPNLTSNYYNKGYDFLVNCYTDAVKGTDLEGKLTFTRDGTLGNGFGDALRNNQVDMLFGVGWTGSALDPYGLIEVYTTYDNRYDADTDFYGAEHNADVVLPRAIVEGDASLEGTATYRASAGDWTDSLGGAKIEVVKLDAAGEPTEEVFECSFGTTVDYSTRGIVLAAVELAALRQYDAIPIAYDSSAALKGMKINFYTEEYIYGVGRGGVKYTSFNYTDAEWAAYVASQGGKLNYKASAE